MKDLAAMNTEYRQMLLCAACYEGTLLFSFSLLPPSPLHSLHFHHFFSSVFSFLKQIYILLTFNIAADAEWKEKYEEADPIIGEPERWYTRMAESFALKRDLFMQLPEVIVDPDAFAIQAFLSLERTNEREALSEKRTRQIRWRALVREQE